MGLTPRQLAEMTDLEIEELKAYESGRLPIMVEVLTKICDALRTTPDRLTGYVNSCGIRTRLDDMPGGEKLLTVYLDGWRCSTVDYTRSGNIQLTFQEVEE